MESEISFLNQNEYDAAVILTNMKTGKLCLKKSLNLEFQNHKSFIQRSYVERLSNLYQPQYSNNYIKPNYLPLLNLYWFKFNQNYPLNHFISVPHDKNEDRCQGIFVCPFSGCGNHYKKLSHLRIHIRTHTGNRPFVCDWPACNKSFTRSDELCRHKRSHTDTRPYKCPFCDLKFLRGDHRLKHIRRKHK